MSEAKLYWAMELRPFEPTHETVYVREPVVFAKEHDRLRRELAKLDAACKYHADNASKMGRELEATQLALGTRNSELDKARALLRENCGNLPMPLGWFERVRIFLAEKKGE